MYMKLFELLAVIDSSLPIWISDGEYNDRYDMAKDVPNELNLETVEMVTIDAQGELNISIYNY